MFSKDLRKSHGPSFFNESIKLSFTDQAGEWIGEPTNGIWGEEILLFGGFLLKLIICCQFYESQHSIYGKLMNHRGTYTFSSSGNK